MELFQWASTLPRCDGVWTDQSFLEPAQLQYTDGKVCKYFLLINIIIYYQNHTHYINLLLLHAYFHLAATFSLWVGHLNMHININIYTYNFPHFFIRLLHYLLDGCCWLEGY